VTFTADNIKNESSDEYPQYYPGVEDYAWSVEKFKRNFRVQIHKNEPLDAVFSLIGIDASIANAFRRILLSEIPTLAIETVYITNNTSIVQDEVLASRLGLVPLKGGKEGIKLMTKVKKTGEDGVESVLSDYNTVVLQLDIECSWKPDGIKKSRAGIDDVNQLYENPNGKLSLLPSLITSKLTTNPTKKSSPNTSSSNLPAAKKNGSVAQTQSNPCTQTSSSPSSVPARS
jgi:DNA-directed RNA polymerase I and III subunit RPAC1